MAKFDGIFNIEGTLKGMTFYKSKDGHMVRTKGGVSKERIAKDPAFERMSCPKIALHKKV